MEKQTRDIQEKKNLIDKNFDRRSGVKSIRASKKQEIYRGGREGNQEIRRQKNKKTNK